MYRKIHPVFIDICDDIVVLFLYNDSSKYSKTQNKLFILNTYWKNLHYNKGQ